MHVIGSEDVYRICAWQALTEALARAHAGEKPLVDRVSLVHANNGTTAAILRHSVVIKIEICRR